MPTNHLQLDCLVIILFKPTSKKTSKHCIAGESSGDLWIPQQSSSDVQIVSIPLRPHSLNKLILVQFIWLKLQHPY